MKFEYECFPNANYFNDREVRSWFIGQMIHNERRPVDVLFARIIRDPLLPHFSTATIYLEVNSICLDESGENYLVEINTNPKPLVCPVKNCLTGLQERSGVDLPYFYKMKDKELGFLSIMQEKGTAFLALSAEKPYLLEYFSLWSEKEQRHIPQDVRFYSYCFSAEWRFFNPANGQQTFEFTGREDSVLFDRMPQLSMPLLITNTGKTLLYIGVRDVGEIEIFPCEAKKISKETIERAKK